MREFTAALIFAAALIATDARAEAWTVQDENGNWQNTDACPKQDCRDTPQPPKQIPGEKPKDRPTLRADKSDYTPGKPYEQHWTGVCKRLPDGRITTHTAFLRDRATAHAQCKAKLMGVKP